MSPDLDPAQLLRLHGATKQVAQACLRRLRAHLDTMAPLFRSRRFLGDHMEGTGKEAAISADHNFADLQQLYGRAAVRPFDLRPEIRSPLESVASQFQIDEWEYIQAIETDRGWQSIRISTPLTWVVSYKSSLSLPSLLGVMAGGGQRDPEAVRAFVLRACLMNELFAKMPALKDLLQGLRFPVTVRHLPQFGELPLVTVSAPFRTFRPDDKLVAMAAGLAGGTSFAEVLDIESVRNLSDPLREEALAILANQQVVMES
jgi:hypothetical protein